MENTFSLSTCWNISRYINADLFVKEIHSAGFHKVELNYGVTKSILNEIMPYIDRGELEVTSLHNFCPASEIDSSNITLSSTNEQRRQSALEFTKQTINLAHNLGTKVVVVHMGEVEGISWKDRDIRNLYNQDMQRLPNYAHEISMLIEMRKQERMPYVLSCEKSLLELSEFICKNGYDIKLGLENRYFYYEIPVEDEYDIWFKKFKGLPLALWYDIGHGEVLEHLSLEKSRNLLNKYKEHLVGIHIHDTDGLSDHHAPGMKKTNFNFLNDYLKMNIIKVVELKSYVPVSDVIWSTHYLEQMMLE